MTHSIPKILHVTESHIFAFIFLFVCVCCFSLFKKLCYLTGMLGLMIRLISVGEVCTYSCY